MPRKDTGPAPQTVSILEASRLLGLHPKSGHYLVREDRFPVRTIHVGKRVFVPVRALTAFLEGREEEPYDDDWISGR